MAYSSQQLKAFGLTQEPTSSKKSSSKSSGGGGGGGGGSSFGNSTSSKFASPINFSSGSSANSQGSAAPSAFDNANAALNSGGSAYERARAVLAAYGKGASSTPSPSVTVAESFASPTFDKEPSYEDLYGEDVDESAVQRRIMQQFQGQINATNQVYDTLLNEARLEGQGRLGSQRAIAARGGLLGSDFGASQKSKVEGYNTDINRGIQAERSAAIGAIMGQMRSAVQQEIQAKNRARQQGAENYIAYLAQSKGARESNLNLAASSLLMQGIDPRTLAPEELSAIATEANLGTNDIINRYLMLQAQQAAEAAAAGDGSFTLSEGAARYDAQGNLIASRPKTFSPRSGGGSDSGIELTAGSRRGLLGSGWTEGDIATIESDVRAYGLTAVINQARADGASETQINALQNAYGSEDGGASRLSRANLASLYQLTDGDTDKPHSFLGIEWGKTDQEKLDAIVGIVKQYQAVGLSDDEILEKMGVL